MQQGASDRRIYSPMDSASRAAPFNLPDGNAHATARGPEGDGNASVPALGQSDADAAEARRVLTQVLERLHERQRDRPWLMGLTSIALAQLLSLPEAVLTRTLTPFVEAGALAYRSGYYATSDFTPQLSPAQRDFFEHAFAVRAGLPPAPVPFVELRAQIRLSAGSIPELARAFETLLAIGALSKVADFVYHGSHITRIRTQLERALSEQGQLTVADFRTITGTSRKYAVPLLEFFDATGVTRRVGDVRVLMLRSGRNEREEQQ